jgi:hypothetical protein
MKNLIREEIDRVNKINNNLIESKVKQKIMMNHIRLDELFNPESLNEDDINQEKIDDVIEKINNNDFEEHNPSSFKEALSKSKHSLMLSDYSESELNEMHLYKLNGYDIGYALKKSDSGKYDELVSVFNNESGVKNIGEILIQNAISNGSCKLDHFDGYLTNLYSKMGFVEVNREKYNPIYDPNGLFKKKYGESDVIYRIHRNCMTN